MKKYILLCVAILLLLGLKMIAVAGIDPGTGIVGTSHDLSAAAGQAHNYGDTTEQAGTDRICIYCHAPHHSLMPHDTIRYLPLWNHAESLHTVFTMYSNGVVFGESVQKGSTVVEYTNTPGTSSLLCLGCHDGSVAVSAYGYTPSSSMGSSTGAKATDRILIGGGIADLRNHHPIGVDYYEAVSRNNQIRPPSSPLRGVNKYGLTIEDLLSNGRVECTTCHDVHNTRNESLKFTWVKDLRSDFCLTCHIK